MKEKTLSRYDLRRSLNKSSVMRSGALVGFSIVVVVALSQLTDADNINSEEQHQQLRRGHGHWLTKRGLAENPGLVKKCKRRNQCPTRLWTCVIRQGKKRGTCLCLKPLMKFLDRNGTETCRCRPGLMFTRDENGTGNCLDTCKKHKHCPPHWPKCKIWDKKTGEKRCVPDCPSGFRLITQKRICVDIHECRKGRCDPNATCTNTNGSFTCHCNEGYTGDGLKCEPITGGDPFDDACLDAHNAKRALHHNTPRVDHDPALANTAKLWCQEMARKDLWQHSTAGTKFRPRGVGENFARSCRFPVPASDKCPDQCTSAINSWYEEICDPGYDYNKPGFTSGAGHFTQIIWKGTTHIGCHCCGYNKVISGRTWRCIITVCHYKPQGNIVTFGKQTFFIDNVLQLKNQRKCPNNKIIPG